MDPLNEELEKALASCRKSLEDTAKQREIRVSNEKAKTIRLGLRKLRSRP